MHRYGKLLILALWYGEASLPGRLFCLLVEMHPGYSWLGMKEGSPCL